MVKCVSLMNVYMYSICVLKVVSKISTSLEMQQFSVSRLQSVSTQDGHRFICSFVKRYRKHDLPRRWDNYKDTPLKLCTVYNVQ
jgi:hypothetical protein